MNKTLKIKKKSASTSINSIRISNNCMADYRWCMADYRWCIAKTYNLGFYHFHQKSARGSKIKWKSGSKTEMKNCSKIVRKDKESNSDILLEIHKNLFGYITVEE